jgi:exopolysaccharide production protein ExoZ
MSSGPPLATAAGTIDRGVPAARAVAKVDAIQYVRAVAAMLVVFYHETMYLGRIGGDSTLHDIFGGRPGLYGVIAFFVLSGFLMADIAPKYRPATFIVHRVIRIYPTYWLCVLLAMVFFAWLWWMVKPNADYVPNIRTMLLAHGFSRDLLRLTLAPIVFPDFPLGIEWTLLYETTFYVIVFLVSASGQVRRLPYLALAWLALIAFVLWTRPANEIGYTSPSIAALPFYGINAGFIFGIVGAHWRDRFPALPSIVAGVVLLVLNEVFATRLAMLQVAGATALIVMGLLALERGGRLPRLPWLKRLGDWSYAMYLVHVPVILATFKLMPGRPPALVVATAALAVVFASAIVGQIDTTVYYRLKRVVDRGPNVARIALATTFLVMFAAAALYGLRQP